MGITIHYEGVARSQADLETILKLVRERAALNNWPIQVVDQEEGLLERVIDEEEADYVGRVFGLVVFPHEDAEPAEFLFGDDRFLQSFCKTQFAGATTHIALVNLLRAIEPSFESLEVVDEGEYWDTGDEAQLVSLLEGCEEALAELVRSNPDASIKIRLESGRIVDALE